MNLIILLMNYLSLSSNNVDDINILSNLTNLEVLWLDDNNISNIEPIKNLNKINKLVLNNNTISMKIEDNNTSEVELPQIISEAKNPNGQIYTANDYILKGCTLSQDGKKIIINDSNAEEISVTIQGGIADATTFLTVFI